jgi:nucleoside 2-deoxyribosyltransferase
MTSIYLAGPDVFLPDAVGIGEAKKALCARFGFEGLFPIDNDEESPPADEIYRTNLALMEKSDAICANLTPFRGPSADAGTAFEVGFFAAQGKPIFAYSSSTETLAQRTRALLGLIGDGRLIEDYGLPDNLMLPGAVDRSGGRWVALASQDHDDLAAFAAFEKVLELMQEAERRGALGQRQ